MLDKLIDTATNIGIKTKAIRFKGDVYYFAKQYNKAVEIYREIVDSYKKSRELFTAKIQIAKCYIKQKEWVKAKNWLLKMRDEYKNTDYIKQIEFYLKKIKE